MKVRTYLATQVLSQSWPAGGALVDDGLSGAEDHEPFRGVLVIATVDDQPTHFDHALPVVFMEVGRGVLIPARHHADHTHACQDNQKVTRPADPF